MLTNQSYPLVRRVGTSVVISLTEQLKELGIEEKEQVFVAVRHTQRSSYIVIKKLKD